MRNYAGHRLAPWLAHVMVSRQETARQLLTPGEVMQLPATDELVLISGLAPIRARKLRFYADPNFTGRIAPAPLLSDERYADRPKPRTNDWGRFARIPDARLARAADTETDSVPEDGGMQQERHPGLAEEAPGARDQAEPVQEVTPDDDGDGAAEKRAIDQARGLNPITRVFGLNESGERDLVPGMDR
jgi:type IV secretion system protein VirD4